MCAFKIVVTDDLFGSYAEEQEELSSIAGGLSVYKCATGREVAEVVADADAVLVNQLEISKELIELMPRCRVISRYGVGVDNVDVAAATAAGMYVASVPDYGTEEVADHAFALLLACIRGVSYKDHAVRQGQWNLIGSYPVHRTSGRVLGVVGFGRIGRAFARRAGGWGFSRLLVHDPYVDPRDIEASGAEPVDLDTLLTAANYVSLHVPLTEETHHLINAQRLAGMARAAIVINTSRGPVIDEAALEEALRDDRLAAAGLDVYEQEPLPQDSGLRSLPNVVLTDHAAYYSVEALSELKRKAAVNVRRVLQGEPPTYAVNRLHS